MIIKMAEITHETNCTFLPSFGHGPPAMMKQDQLVCSSITQRAVFKV